MLILINLEAAQARRLRMGAQLQALGLGYERVGFDGRHRTLRDIEQWAGQHFPNLVFKQGTLSGAEIGCWLSHLSAWRRLQQDTDLAACTVIEDDLILRAGFRGTVDALGRQTDFDLVYLGTSSRNLSMRRRTSFEGLSLHEPVGPVFNTWGYTVRRAFVERFFAQPRLDIRWPIDHVLGGRIRRLAPRIAVLRPPVVEEDAELGAASQIEPHTWRLDRSRLVEFARRRLLASRVGDLYYALYRYL